MYCGNCGALLNNTDSFCQNCGKAVKVNDSKNKVVGE